MTENEKTIVRKTPICPLCMSAKHIKVDYMYNIDKDGNVSFKVLIDCENCYVMSESQSEKY